MQLRKQIPNEKKLIFDLNNKNTNIFNTRLNFANSYLKLNFYKKVMQLFNQTFKARRQFLDNKYQDILGTMKNLAKFFTKLGQDKKKRCKYTNRYQKY